MAVLYSINHICTLQSE